ncbi:MAG: type II secretion system F family protein [archaeon]
MKRPEIISIIVGIIILILDFALFSKSKLFYFLIGLAVLIAILPFLIKLILSSSKDKEKEEMFLDFSRNLVESVKVGTPISKSIIAIAKKDYGILTVSIQKLANQISLGIPVRKALFTFSNDVKNKTISRAITLIIQAEQSGGNIGVVLDSVVKSISQIETLKRDRQSKVYGLVIQGYIIFLIFIVIMLFVQLKFIPLIGGALEGTTGISGLNLQEGNLDVLERAFLVLLMVQAFFAGLVIGKLSQGSIKHGIKHSLILLAITYLIITLSKALV